MAKFSEINNSFVGGEITPKAYGRTDLPQYRQSCEEIYNCLVYPQGGAGMRPGFQFVDKQVNAINILATTRIIPFVVSQTESYLIVIDTTGVRRFRNIVSGTEGSVVNATPIIGSFSLSNYTSTELNEIQYAQSGDVLYLTHPNHEPVYLIRTATNTFKIYPYWYSDITLVGMQSLAFKDANITGITLVLSSNSTSAVVTMTASNPIFNSSHVGTFWRLSDPGLTGTKVYQVTAFTDSTHMSVKQFGANGTPDLVTTQTANWAEPAWSAIRGWPRTVCFFDSRLVYGGTAAEPDSFWGTQIGDIFELSWPALFAPSTAAIVNSDAYTATLGSQEASAIQWISPHKTLIMGTLGREYVVQPADQTGTIGPLNINVSAETDYGSRYVQAVRADGAIIFIQRSGQKVRDMVFSFVEDQYKSVDVTLYAEHMPKKALAERASYLQPAIIAMAHQETDNGITWFLDNNGGLFGVTRNRDEKVTAFHYHGLGGNLAGELPKVQSLCVVPSADATHDDLYVVVTRTINSSSVTYIEKMGKEFLLDDVQNSSTDIVDKPVYLDSAKLVQLGSPGTTFGGFSHLEGETVGVVADGNWLGTFVIASGNLVLASLYTEVIVGLPYIGRLIPLNFDIGAIDGTAQNRLKKLDEVGVRFYRTVGAKFGPSLDRLDSIEFRDPSLAMNQPTPLFTGDKVLNMPANVARRVQVMVVQDIGMPMQVVSIFARGMTYD